MHYYLYFSKRLDNCNAYTDSVAGKKGIEIGGPSSIFIGVIPVYHRAQKVDGVNFSCKTIWEGEISHGDNYNYYRDKRGYQYIADATDLSKINPDAYDFLISSNCLEHIANPIKAVLEWKRVIKTGGSMILILPNKVGTFDHNRPCTTFEHIVSDFINGVTEHDLTHLDEILSLHDLAMDPRAGDMEHFRARGLDNFNNRCLHQHVFDANIISSMLSYCGFEVVRLSQIRTALFALAIKRN